MNKKDIIDEVNYLINNEVFDKDQLIVMDSAADIVINNLDNNELDKILISMTPAYYDFIISIEDYIENPPFDINSKTIKRSIPFSFHYNNYGQIILYRGENKKPKTKIIEGIKFQKCVNKQRFRIVE